LSLSLNKHTLANALDSLLSTLYNQRELGRKDSQYII